MYSESNINSLNVFSFSKMAGSVNLIDHLNIQTTTIICNEGQEVPIKRSLLPRLKVIYQMSQQANIGDPAFVRVDGLKRETLLKLVSWLEHYQVSILFVRFYGF